MRSGLSRDRGRPARMWAEGPPVCSSGQDARAPRRTSMRSGLSRERGRPARMWAEGPPVFKRARCPRSQESIDAERSFPGSRASRPQWAEGPPVCSSGQDARVPRRASMRSGLSWDRGRPARMWAEGPPVCSSGQDARDPRKDARDPRGCVRRSRRVAWGDAKRELLLSDAPAVPDSFPYATIRGRGSRPSRTGIGAAGPPVRGRTTSP